MMEKLLKITEISTLPKKAKFSNHRRYRSITLIAQIEDLNEDFIKIIRPYNFYIFREISCQRAIRSVRVGWGRFIVLNDSAT